MTLAGDIIRGKALDLLVERAEIDDEAPTDEAEAAAEAEPPTDEAEETP